MNDKCSSGKDAVDTIRTYTSGSYPVCQSCLDEMMFTVRVKQNLSIANKNLDEAIKNMKELAKYV